MSISNTEICFSSLLIPPHPGWEPPIPVCGTEYLPPPPACGTEYPPLLSTPPAVGLSTPLTVGVSTSPSPAVGLGTSPRLWNWVPPSRTDPSGQTPWLCWWSEYPLPLPVDRLTSVKTLPSRRTVKICFSSKTFLALFRRFSYFLYAEIDATIQVKMYVLSIT